EPLLTMEEWESVRHRLELNRRPYKGTGTRKYLLSGIVECGICGAKMTGDMGAKEKPIYSCRPNHCMYRSAGLLDDVVSEVVCAVLSGAGAFSGQSPTGDIERLRERRTEARRRMDEAAEAFAQGAITLKQLTSINEWCQRDLEDLDREVAKYETTPTLSRLLGAEDVKKEWGTLPIATKRLVSAALVRVVALKATSGAIGSVRHDGRRVQRPRSAVAVGAALAGHLVVVPCNLGGSLVSFFFEPALELCLTPLLVPRSILVGRPAHAGATVED